MPLGLPIPFPLATRPFTAPSSPPPPLSPAAHAYTPPLTLEQHASLCAELAAAPDHAAGTLARYRITPAQKEALEAYYRDRFTREPGLQATWYRAYRTYGMWFIKNVWRRG